VTGEARHQAGREALRQVRSAVRWKRIDMGGSIFLAALAMGAGAALLVGAALHVIGPVVGAAVGLTLGSLGGLMLSSAADARRDARALVGHRLPRARLLGPRPAPPDPLDSSN
jgi:hypothetical protein